MVSVSYLSIIYILSLFSVNCEPTTYTCAPGSNCEVDCALNIPNFHCNNGGTGQSTINATMAHSLLVYCHDPNACGNMLIECPITSEPESKCRANCDLANSCNSILIHTHNTTNVTLACGANELDRDTATSTQCINITIDGDYSLKEEQPPPVQNITIICNDEGNVEADTPSCDRIMTRNIAQMGAVIPNSDVTLSILCTVDFAPEEETVWVCNRLYIDAGKAKYVSMYIEGDITNSHFNLTDLALLEVDIQILRWGTIWNSTINAPEVQNKFYINSSSDMGFLSSNIIGPYIDYQTACEFETHYPSRFESSTFEGRFYIHGDGYYVNSIFNAKTAGYVDITVDVDGVWERNKLLIENSINATIRFYGHASGYIDAKQSKILSIICKSYYPEYSCLGLVLDIPEYIIVENIKKQRAFLECIDYGCSNITTISENGVDDIAITAISCDCSTYGGNGESGNSCIGVLNIGCGTEKAIFNGVTCDGSNECCANIKSETTNGLCSSIDDSNGMSDWEVIGVFIGCLFGLLLLGSLWCYCSNQQTIKDHIKKTQDTNPYTQAIIEEEDEQKGNAIISTKQATSAGYGATKDVAI
eukprot:245506_1